MSARNNFGAPLDFNIVTSRDSLDETKPGEKLFKGIVVYASPLEYDEELKSGNIVANLQVMKRNLFIYPYL